MCPVEYEYIRKNVGGIEVTTRGRVTNNCKEFEMGNKIIWVGFRRLDLPQTAWIDDGFETLGGGKASKSFIAMPDPKHLHVSEIVHGTRVVFGPELSAVEYKNGDFILRATYLNTDEEAT